MLILDEGASGSSSMPFPMDFPDLVESKQRLVLPPLDGKV